MTTTEETSDRAENRIARFFADLEARHHESLLARTTGTLRFDLSTGSDVEHWYVSVNKGDIDVSRDNKNADVIFGIDRACFAGMVEGRLNAMAAVLRDEVAVEGDLGLAMSFQRLLPGPPDAVGPAIPTHRRKVTR